MLSTESSSYFSMSHCYRLFFFRQKKSKEKSAKPKAKSGKPKRAMPHFGKPPEALVRTFENALKDFPMAERRLTFGAPSAMIDGKMFAGLHNDKMILKLSEQDATAMPGAKPFEPMPERAMKGWVVVPPSVLNSPRELNVWMSKAFEHSQTLPKKILGHDH